MQLIVSTNRENCITLNSYQPLILHRPYVKIPSRSQTNATHFWLCRQSPNPRAQMLLHPVNWPAPGLLAKRMNETPSYRLGEHFVAGIEVLCGITLKAS